MFARYTKLCWVGKHIDIIIKPTNSPTQGQLNPEKNEVKSGLWATFSPQQIRVRGLGLVLYRKQTTRNLTKTKSPQTPSYDICKSDTSKYEHIKYIPVIYQVLSYIEYLVVSSQRILGCSSFTATTSPTCSCLLYTSPSPRDQRGSRMPSSA